MLGRGLGRVQCWVGVWVGYNVGSGFHLGR